MPCLAGEALGRAERFSPAESCALHLLFPSQVLRLSFSTSSFARLFLSSSSSSLSAPRSSLPVLAGQTLLPPPFIRLNLLKPLSFISLSPSKPPDFSHRLSSRLPPPHRPHALSPSPCFPKREDQNARRRVPPFPSSSHPRLPHFCTLTHTGYVLTKPKSHLPPPGCA